MASSASALSISPSTGSATGKGSVATFSAAGGPTYSCTQSTDYWSWKEGTNGQLKTTLTGCGLTYLGSRMECNSSGQAAGVIKFNNLGFTLVYLDAAKTKFGYKLTPESGSVVAEFACGGGFYNYKWTGSVLGQITEPALNVSSLSGKFSLTATGATQTYQQVEGTGTAYHLYSSQNGGPLVSLGATEDHPFSSFEKFTFLP
ncbi:MAG: hypothetical protein ACTHNY_01195 [Solirubrobacterales bacterium]